jgi:plastocyanin
MRVLRLITAVAVVALSATLITHAPAAAQQRAKTATVKMVDFEFPEPNVTVEVGTVVTWSNDGDHPHTATDRGGTFDTDPVAPDGDASVTFSVPGTYSYFCRINPSKMNGTLVVTAGATPAPVNRIQALDPAREGETLRFDPKELTVPTGSQIVFANVGGKPHTLTADASDPAFDSGVVTPGAEGGRFAGTNVSISLPEPGQFAFHCEVHPQAMTGVLTVVGEAKKPPAAVSTAPRQVTVDMKAIEFQPDQVSVAPGGKVTWKNFDAAPHDAKFDQNDIPQTKLLQRGDSASITAPDDPGSYAYICSVHPSMTGVIVVVGQNTGDPTGAAAAKPVAAVARGPGGGVTSASLITGILGAFLGGFGIAAFVTRRKPKATTG